MGQSWADHNRDFLDRARKASRITFSDFGVVRRYEGGWAIEHVSDEAVAFAQFHNQRAA